MPTLHRPAVRLMPCVDFSSSIQYPASSILPIGSKMINFFSLPASQPPNFLASLPSPQQILSFLSGGVFLEFVKPRADNGGDVGYDCIPDIRVIIKKLPEAFSVDFD